MAARHDGSAEDQRRSRAIPTFTFGSGKGILENLFGYMRDLKATDAKDKVFALHALLQTAGFDIGPPDYAKPVALVYAEATRRIIKATSSLNILTTATTMPTSAEMPSWVPDWSGESHPSLTKYVMETPHATKSSIHKDNPGTKTMELIVQGIVMGTVQEVSQDCMSWETLDEVVFSSELDFPQDVMDYFLRLSQSWVDIAGLTKPFSEWTDECWKRHDCLASVLLAMLRNTQPNESPATAHEDIRRIIQLICHADPSSIYYYSEGRAIINPNQHTDLFSRTPSHSFVMQSPASRAFFMIAQIRPLFKRLHSLYLAAYKRSIFRTNDSLGCGLCNVQQGDLLVLLKGGNLPFVVSSTEKG